MYVNAEGLQHQPSTARILIRTMLERISQSSKSHSANKMIEDCLRRDSLYYYIHHSSFEMVISDNKASQVYDLENTFKSKKECLIVISSIVNDVGGYTFKIVFPEHVNPNQFIKGGMGWYIFTDDSINVKEVTEIEI